MPTPNKGEKQKDFVSRCIPIVMKEKGTKDNKHAVAKCHGIWKQNRGMDMTTGAIRDYTKGEQQNIIRLAWEDTHGASDGKMPWSWPAYVMDDYIVVGNRGKWVKVTYSLDKSGEVTFADPKEWKEVQHTFRGEAEPGGVRSQRQLAIPIRAVEKDGKTVYKCYGILFNDEDHLDAYGTYFDKRTHYHLDWFDKRPWLYHHTMHPAVKHARVGDWFGQGEDDEGIFFLGEMAESFRFQEAVKDLIRAEALFPSSGTFGYASEFEEDGHAVHWPIGEISSTVKPANFYQQPVKAAVMRAFRALEGGIMSEQESRGLLDKLGDLFSGKRDVPAEETPPIAQVAQVAQDAQAPSEDTPAQPPTLDVEAASRALGLPTIVEAIRAVDGHIKTLTEGQQALTTLVTGLAKTEMERVQAVMKGDDWSKQLYSVSNEGEVLSPEEQKQLPTQTALKPGESVAAHIMDAQQQLRH